MNKEEHRDELPKTKSQSTKEFRNIVPVWRAPTSTELLTERSSTCCRNMQRNHITRCSTPRNTSGGQKQRGKNDGVGLERQTINSPLSLWVERAFFFRGWRKGWWVRRLILGEVVGKDGSLFKAW